MNPDRHMPRRNPRYLLPCLVLLCLAACCPADGPAPAAMPRVMIRGDRFFAGDKEFRIWGFNIAHGLEENGVELTDEQVRRNADRLGFLGVNLIRFHTLDTMHYGSGVGLLRAGEGVTSTRTLINVKPLFRLLDSFKDKGIYVALHWYQGRIYQPGDSDILTTTPQDKAAWEAAIREIGNNMRAQKSLAVFDERCEALMKEFAAQVLNLRHPVTGVALKDDPQIAMIDMINEGYSFRLLYTKRLHEKMPAYFQAKLASKWHDYLRSRYGSDEKLRAAWKADKAKGLADDESLAKGNVALLPLYGDEGFSEARRDDVLRFFTQLDMAFQRRMAEYLRKVGYPGPTVLSDFNGAHAGTDKYWLESDLQPYFEDHGYAPVSQSLFNWSRLNILKTRIQGRSHPYDFGKPYWRSEDRCGLDGVSWERIAYPLYSAVYFSLTGIDGVTYHTWTMRTWMSYQWAKAEEGLYSTHECNGDPAWQLAFRAAGRLFKSGEIKPLTDPAALTRLHEKTSNIHNDQVWRHGGKEGVLTVEAENFCALACDRPRKVSFRAADLDITSDRCNVVVVEKLSDKEFEVTAVGLAGETTKTHNPETKQRNMMDFKPTTYVCGTITFKTGAVKSVALFDDAGKEIRRISPEDSVFHFEKGIRLYRVTLE